MNPIGPSSVFISYSHRNPDWKDRLLRHLNVFERHHLLEVWHDETMGAGDDWERKIDEAMANARLAVVLLCPDALKSTFMLNKEFPVLERRWNGNEITVVPILCKSDCPWEANKWLAKLQIKPRLASGPTALSQLPRDADRHLRHLATEIAEHVGRIALSELRPPSLPAREKAGAGAEVKTYLDKFPLTSAPGLREEKLIGREQELALLDLAFAQPHTAIVSLVAWGGVGKTMLVQHWLRRLDRGGWYGARRVYAWSFYSQGTKEDRQASEDSFLAHALEWFGVQCEPTLSPWDKGRLLADAVTRERTLLILDGIEPLQYPPGPMGGQLRKVGDDESYLRAPGVQSMLKQLARNANPGEHRGLCLVTTRVWLADLSDFQRREGSSWGSVLRVDLGNLTDEAGAALLHHAGAKRAGAAEIDPDDAELLAASREVDGHALTLNLLGRFLARAHLGDVRRRDLVKFEEADRKEQGGTTFKMLAAFENWFSRGGEAGARQLAALRVMGLFDRPADFDALREIRSWPAISDLTASLFDAKIRLFGWEFMRTPISNEEWNVAISFLCDCSLVSQSDHIAEGQQQTLDSHPLVREYFSCRIQADNPRAWRSAHRRLYNHLKYTAEYQPDTLEGMAPLFQAVTHGCYAKMYQRACDEVYRDRIKRGGEGYSLRTLGAFGFELAALTCFFEEPWSRLAPELVQQAKAFLINETAFCLRGVGRLSEALSSVRAGFDMYMTQRDWINAPTAAGTLSELELALGNLPAAVHIGEQAVDLARLSDQISHQINSAATLADAIHHSGDWSRALALFRETESISCRFLPDVPYLFSSPGFLYCNLLFHNAEQTFWRWSLLPQLGIDLESRQKAVAVCDDVERRVSSDPSLENPELLFNGPLDQANHQLLRGRSAFYRAVLAADGSVPASDAVQHAGQELTGAVDALRRAGQHDMRPHGFIARAPQRCIVGDFQGAHEDLNEAWDIAERGPMRLHLADIHLHRARLFFREKHYPWKSPADDLAAAEKLINDCGYHRRDEELADAKRAILGAP